MGDPDRAVSDLDLIRRLLAAGFDPSRPGWLGQTALHHYAGRGETEAVRLLLDHGADPDVLDDEHRGTPLAWAAAAGHDHLAAMLERSCSAPRWSTIPRAGHGHPARQAGPDAGRRGLDWGP